MSVGAVWGVDKEICGSIVRMRIADVVAAAHVVTPAFMAVGTQGAVKAVTKLLEEAPGDGEALDVVVALDPATPQRQSLLERGRDALLMALHESPGHLDNQRRLARVSHALGDGNLEQSRNQQSQNVEKLATQLREYARRVEKTKQAEKSEEMLTILRISHASRLFEGRFSSLAEKTFLTLINSSLVRQPGQDDVRRV